MGSGAAASAGVLANIQEAKRILESDRFDSLIEGVRAETVSELLDQAEELLAKGWLVAAMVMAGGAVESTIRHFCETQDPPIEVPGHGSIEKYKGAIDARRKDVPDLPITANHTKMINAWGGLRNDAAHDPVKFGQEQTKASIENTITAIRQFLMMIGPH